MLAGLALAVLPRLADLLGGLPRENAGNRIVDFPELAGLLSANSRIGDAAAQLAGAGAKPVRAILFDKSASANWSLGWHQDRVIAVSQREDVEGFGAWSVKQGIPHCVAPPELFSRMVTLRIHLDRVDKGNGPLEVLLRSHEQGRIAANAIPGLAQTLQNYICLAEPGDVWAYRSAIVHRSLGSSSKEPRRVLHVDYSTDQLPGALQWKGI